MTFQCILATTVGLRVLGEPFDLTVPRDALCSVIHTYLKIAVPALRSSEFPITIRKPSATMPSPVPVQLEEEHLAADLVDTTMTVAREFVPMAVGVQAIICVGIGRGTFPITGQLKADTSPQQPLAPTCISYEQIQGSLV